MKNKELDIFCRNIKKLRKEKGLNKKEMAKLLGIGTTSLTKIEAGEVPPRLGVNILLFAWLNFDIKPHELFL